MQHIPGLKLALLAAAALAYFNPLTQEALNTAYLGPKLERARALQGQTVEALLADLGEPRQIVHGATAPGEGQGYVLYGSAPWAPFAETELVVPTSDDGERVSLFAHYAD